jgi:hypothetical protein
VVIAKIDTTKIAMINFDFFILCILIFFKII